MNTKTNNISAQFIIAAGVVILLAGACATHGQESQEKSADALVTPVAYTSNDLRDPFEGYVIEEAVPVAELSSEEENVVLPALTISGITWGSSYPQAIVNDKVVKPGDMIGEVKVVSIAKDGLVLLYKKTQFILPAPGQNSIQKSGHRVSK